MLTLQIVSKRVKSRSKTFRRIYLREWRKFRHLSQGALVERLKERVVGVSVSTISRIENSKQGYTQAILEAAAWALNCEPEDILIRNPLDNAAPWSIWDDLKKATPDEKAMVVRMLRKTG